MLRDVYVCVWLSRRECVCTCCVIWVSAYAWEDAFLCLHRGVEACSCSCVCVLCVYVPGASDGKRWLCSNARVVRKPAGSLVLATAGGLHHHHHYTSLSFNLRKILAWTKGASLPRFIWSWLDLDLIVGVKKHQKPLHLEELVTLCWLLKTNML